MKQTTIIIFLVAVTQVCLAYEDFKPGYIVLQNGDTVKGFIDDQQWASSPTIFKFKKSENENAVEYSPATVRYFYIENSMELYSGASFSFTTQQNESSTISLKDSRQLTFNGFLTVLCLGKIQLFRMDFEDVEYFFIKADNEAIAQLELKKIIRSGTVKEKGGQYGGFLPVYKQTLKNKTTDCPESQKTVEQLDYSEKALTAFIKKYNSCVGKVEYVKQYAKKYYFQKGLLAGAGVAKVALDFTQQLGSKELSALAPQVGAYFVAYRKRGQGKWGLYNELTFGMVNGKPYTHEYYVGPFKYISDNEIAIKHLTLNIAVRYSTTSVKTNLFFQIGGYRSASFSGATAV